MRVFWQRIKKDIVGGQGCLYCYNGPYWRFVVYKYLSKLVSLRRSIWEKIIDWLKYRLTDKFTVAHDLSPFSHPYNRREELDHFKGLWSAKWFARNWIWKHPMGQARILEGWHHWPEETKVDIDGLDPMDGTAGYVDSR